MERSGSGRILVIPIGPVRADILSEIAATLARVFQCEAGTGGGMGVPEIAFDTQREQFYSSAILKELLTRKPGGAFRLLGVIDEDLYIPQLNFVFGEADLQGGVAVISNQGISRKTQSVLKGAIMNHNLEMLFGGLLLAFIAVKYVIDGFFWGGVSFSVETTRVPAVGRMRNIQAKYRGEGNCRARGET